MKHSMPNKDLNVSNNYLNHVAKAVTTYICRNKECFEFPIVLIKIQNYVTLPKFPDA